MKLINIICLIKLKLYVYKCVNNNNNNNVINIIH